MILLIRYVFREVIPCLYGPGRLPAVDSLLVEWAGDHFGHGLM